MDRHVVGIVVIVIVVVVLAVADAEDCAPNEDDDDDDDDEDAHDTWKEHDHDAWTHMPCAQALSKDTLHKLKKPNLTLFWGTSQPRNRKIQGSALPSKPTSKTKTLRISGFRAVRFG